MRVGLQTCTDADWSLAQGAGTLDLLVNLMVDRAGAIPLLRAKAFFFCNSFTAAGLGRLSFSE